MRRHDLLSATPEAWATMLEVHPSIAGLPLVDDWARNSRPVIVRRYLEGESTDAVPVALPLPPSLGKGRVAMGIDASARLTEVAPVSLREARGLAPQPWQETIDRLLGLGLALDCMPRVFGALLWQHLTGLTYLSSTSDLDLLWVSPNAAAVSRLVTGLAELDATSPVRLDGEIVLPDGGGVNWRELLGAPETVLVKTLHTVEIRATSRLFA